MKLIVKYCRRWSGCLEMRIVPVIYPDKEFFLKDLKTKVLEKEYEYAEFKRRLQEYRNVTHVVPVTSFVLGQQVFFFCDFTDSSGEFIPPEVFTIDEFFEKETVE